MKKSIVLLIFVSEYIVNISDGTYPYVPIITLLSKLTTFESVVSPTTFNVPSIITLLPI